MARTDPTSRFLKPPPPPVTSLLAADRLQLVWEEGILQQTTELKGAATVWTDLWEIVPPYAIPLDTGDVMFFRTKRPND